MKKATTITAGLASVASVPVAFGQVAINQILPSTTTYYLDIDDGSFLPGDSTDAEISIRFRSGGSSADHGKAEISGTLSSSTSILLSGSYVAYFGFGDTLSGVSSNPGSAHDTESNIGGGAWSAVSGTGYVGFSRGGNLGWIELNYNPSTGGSGSIEVVSFAWDGASGITLAGVPVPEPAAAGAIMSLLAGSAAAFGRRRRRRS